MSKDNYCSKCGEKINNNIKYCPNCGNKIGQDNNESEYHETYSIEPPKSKIAAGLLGILLGSLGIHNFYLGYTSKGVAQLLLTLVGWILCGIGPIVAGIWGLVEGILILTDSITEDANGNKLQN